MTFPVSYMGTKRRLAGQVANIVTDLTPGPFVDLFAGMCSVGSAVAPSRQVWSNDLQRFAHTVATARFCSRELAPRSIDAAGACFSTAQKEAQQLRARFGAREAFEQRALDAGRITQLSETFEEGIARANTLASQKASKRYDVITTRFAGTYFSYGQSIEIDSIRRAIDVAYPPAEATADVHRWALLALCVAMSRCTTSTGHFAQPLAPKARNLGKFAAQRTRSIWTEWLNAFPLMIPTGSRAWRAKNRAYQTTANELLAEMTKERAPAVIYADPPYTKDQYSRFYHLYETLILYDHPEAHGRGLYRQGRSVSEYCAKGTVAPAMRDLIASAARLGSSLVLSYPVNGILERPGEQIPEMIYEAYGTYPDVFHFDHFHSTLGASKGPERAAVVETVYRVAA